MGTVGADFGPYATWLERCGISLEHVKIINNTYTAQAFITTDLDDNQITAFHPGAMNFAHENQVTDAKKASIGIVSPNGREGMVTHATQFAEANIPFIFDPGQGMPMFDGDNLLTFIDKASWVTVNSYEMQLMQQRTGKSPHELAERVQALIVTSGSEGPPIYAGKKRIEIPTATPKAVLDPTGCGDAYRAGILYGLMHDMDWETTGRIASLMGAIKVEQHGTQNHHFERAQFHARFKESFGYSL